MSLHLQSYDYKYHIESKVTSNIILCAYTRSHAHAHIRTCERHCCPGLMVVHLERTNTSASLRMASTLILPSCYDKIFTTKHIYYIVEIDFLQKCLAISILFLNFAPNISSVVFSCTMVLIVCLHLSLLSTGGFFYTLSPVPPPYPRLCNRSPRWEFNHPFFA